MRRLLVLVALILAGSIGNAQAAVITFEDLPVDPPGPPPVGDRISGGFLFDSPGDHIHIDDGTDWGANNGTTIMVLDFATTHEITFSPIGGGPFALAAIDLSKANTFSTTSSTNVDVIGNLLGGGTVSTSFALNPNFVFTTFTFDSSWTNLASVVLDGFGATCCGPSPGNYFAVDNIVVEAGAVPEPGMLSLLGLGTAYVLSRRRRSRR